VYFIALEEEEENKRVNKTKGRNITLWRWDKCEAKSVTLSIYSFEAKSNMVVYNIILYLKAKGSNSEDESCKLILSLRLLIC
jgi:hypothetical protein